MKKSSRLGIKILVIIVAVVAFSGIAVWAYPKVKKMTLSDAEYYQYVETKARDKQKGLLDQYIKTVQNNSDFSDKGHKVDVKITPSDYAKDMISGYGLDISGLENVELEAAVGMRDETLDERLQIKANDECLLTTNIAFNQDGYLLQVPELSKSYLQIKGLDEETAGANEWNNIAGILQNEFVNGGYFKDIADISVWYQRYTDLLIEEAKEVTKKEATCKAEGVSVQADSYQVTFSKERINDVSQKVLASLKKDKEIKKWIEKYAKNQYSAYQNQIDQLMKDMSEFSKEEQEQLSAEMVVYVSEEDIIGREIKFQYKEDEVKISMLYPVKDDKFGLHFAVQAGETPYVTISGQGTIKKGVLNGDFVLGLDESLDQNHQFAAMDTFLSIKVEDYSFVKLLQGEMSGTITYSTDAIAELANYSMRVENKGNMKKSESKIDILAGADSVLTMDVISEVTEQLEPIVPAESDKIYDITDSSDMSKFQEEIDIMSLLENVTNVTGIDVLGMYILNSNSADMLNE